MRRVGAGSLPVAAACLLLAGAAVLGTAVGAWWAGRGDPGIAGDGTRGPSGAPLAAASASPRPSRAPDAGDTTRVGRRQSPTQGGPGHVQSRRPSQHPKHAKQAKQAKPPKHGKHSPGPGGHAKKPREG